MGLSYDSWLDSQKIVLGSALVDCHLIPRVVTESKADDYQQELKPVYNGMKAAFLDSSRNEDLTPIVVLRHIGDSEGTRKLLAELMELYSPGVFDETFRFLLDRAKLDRLQTLGANLQYSRDLPSALSLAEQINSQMMSHSNHRIYEPRELWEDWFVRHTAGVENLETSYLKIGSLLNIRPGNLVIIGAEQSGGKTSLAIEWLWDLSRKYRVLFISLETDEGTLFDRMTAYIGHIPMESLMNGSLPPAHMDSIALNGDEITGRTYALLPESIMTVTDIKAVMTNYRADIVFIDYLGLIYEPGHKSRTETVSEISLNLKRLARQTGKAIFALSQVNLRDPMLAGKPLTIHSCKDSAQIESDADIMLMLDKFVDKDIKKLAPRANRILRCVKNKNGQLFDMPMQYDGRYQHFERVHIPNEAWEKLKQEKAAASEEKQKSKEKRSSSQMEQFSYLDGEDPNLPY